jgi:hypothetical protein
LDEIAVLFGCNRDSHAVGTHSASPSGAVEVVVGKGGQVEVYPEKKSAFWKVWIASELKRTTRAPSTWIAGKLNVGAPQLVGTYVNRLQRGLSENPSSDYEEFICQFTE